METQILILGSRTQQDSPPRNRMHHHQLLNSVRDQVQSTLTRLGADDTPPHETILIRDGMYCGRRFYRDEFMAVWFIEEGEIKFFDQAGAVAAVEKLASHERIAA